MNSATVNKLIRSEIWPLLRTHGFTRFDARNAWRDQGALIDVVNFESFNSYVADQIGCTTYSFGVNLGVYVAGGRQEVWFRPDGRGRLRVPAGACDFRTRMEKGAPIDGFENASVLYIDPDGRTTGPVFREVKRLLTSSGEDWFNSHRDVDALADRLCRNEALRSVTAVPGSFVWNDLAARLRVRQHHARPTARSAEVALDRIDLALGAIQEIYLPALEPPEEIDRKVRYDSGRMLSIGVAADAKDRIVTAEPTPLAGKKLWSVLRERGFNEFTERLAHRTVGERIDVVSRVRPDTRERNQVAPGSFRVGIGLYWPALRRWHTVRSNRQGQERPNLEECRVILWLGNGREGSLVAGEEEAVGAWMREGERWMRVCDDTEALLDLLRLPDWQIFLRFPWLRGIGAKGSVDREMLCAVLETERGQSDAAGRHFEAAGRAMEDVLPHVRERKEELIRQAAEHLGWGGGNNAAGGVV